MQTLPESYCRTGGPGVEVASAGSQKRSVGQPEEFVKKWADGKETVEKPMNRRKMLDKKKGRVIFDFHASVFVLGVL